MKPRESIGELDGAQPVERMERTGPVERRPDNVEEPQREALGPTRVQLEPDPIMDRFVSVTKRLPSVPTSSSGTLGTREVYRAPNDPSVGYLLPTYRVGLGGGKPQVRLELTPDAPHAGRLSVVLDGHLRVPRPRLDDALRPRDLGGLNRRFPADPDDPTRPRPRPVPSPREPAVTYLPLPHDVSLSLSFIVADVGSGMGRTTTRKVVAFDQVRQQNERRIQASATLPSLAELDAVCRALGEPLAEAELVINCRALIATRLFKDFTSLRAVEPAALSFNARLSSLAVGELGVLAPKAEALAPLHRIQATQVVKATCDQRLAFRFDPLAHPEIFPARQPGSGASLVRFAVNGQVLFQDALERHVFYYVPDEFRLCRDDLRSPTYKPSLSVDFFSVASDTEGMEAYGVRLGFRAVPYLAPQREVDAYRFIQEHGLVPNGRPPALLPLLPEWAQLSLTLPDERGSAPRTEVRPTATVLFDRYVMDSLLLTPAAFAEIFTAMQTNRDTFSGAVSYKLAGSDVAHTIPLTGRLDKLVGPSIDASLLSAQPSAEGHFRVRLSNGLESPVTLRQLAIYLIEDPLTGRRVLARVDPNALPRSLAPGASTDLDVSAPLSTAFGAHLVLLEHDVAIDVVALWLSILAAPGWDGVLQIVDVSVDASYFAAARAADRVRVHFNAGETSIELDAAQPSGRVRLLRPLLAYLMKLDAAQEYFYQAEVWRAPDGASPAQLVATAPIQRQRGPVLSIAPPLA
jgi:hypothetical protein